MDNSYQSSARGCKGFAVVKIAFFIVIAAITFSAISFFSSGKTINYTGIIKEIKNPKFEKLELINGTTIEICTFPVLQKETNEIVNVTFDPEKSPLLKELLTGEKTMAAGEQLLVTYGLRTDTKDKGVYYVENAKIEDQ